MINTFYLLLLLQPQTGFSAYNPRNETHLNYTNHMRKQAIHSNFQQHYQSTANIFAYLRLLITSQCKQILLERSTSWKFSVHLVQLAFKWTLLANESMQICSSLCSHPAPESTVLFLKDIWLSKWTLLRLSLYIVHINQNTG